MGRVRLPLAVAVVLAAAVTRAPAEEDAALPRRVRRIVVHTLGNPSYEAPERRWIFYPPEQTQRLWRPRFGAHWIVWTDGSIWPRHVRPGEPRSFRPPAGPAGATWRRVLAGQAAPVYSHLHNGNSHSLGIEVAHSGRAGDAFPRAQMRSLAWLLRTLLGMSGGRLTPAQVFGHKDLDRRPAYLARRCARSGCAVFVDDAGRPYRRRVDPPEGLFAELAREGLVVPRAGREGDHELKRAEALGDVRRPHVAGRR